MFAVPGWSLSPALLKAQDPSSVGNESRTSKKRKRKPGVEVTGSNVADLFDEHVGGTKPKAKPAKPANILTGANATKTPPKDTSQSTTKAEVAKAAIVDNANASSKPTKKEKRKDRSNAHNKQSEKVETKSTQASKAGDQQEQHVTKMEVKPDAGAQNSLLKLTPLQAAMRQKLMGARFRHLNQTLYTAPSTETLKLFDTNPTFFDEYHEGFRQQVSSWPENPVDTFVKELLERGKVKDSRRDKKHSQKGERAATPELQLAILPRTSGNCTIADLGCGDAALASQLSKAGKKLNMKVLSYDLSSKNPLVTKADIANLPLDDGSVNIAIFCLALMGTNWTDFIDEAWRILHWRGELWVAEIKSRFGRPVSKRVEHSVGKRRKVQQKPSQREPDDAEMNDQLRVVVDGADSSKQSTDVTAFVQVLQKRGFALNGEGAVDLSNKMFVKLKFTKSVTPVKGKNVKEAPESVARPGMKRAITQFIDAEEDDAGIDEASVLKPCLYKVR